MKKILIVEDDLAISMGLEVVLKEENYDVMTVNDGKLAYEIAMKEPFNLIILDVMLPNKTGFEICKDLRKNKILIPILFLSSKNEELDKIVGFETGGDDYMTKPFSLIELKLRIKAILRRADSTNNEISADSYKLGNYELILDKYDLYLDNKPIGLSVKEFNLIKLLMER
ncbi:MAG: response regulator transcription factor [Candidatus Kapabacteria bacterium]|nr:response regulator transcription factor [Ignavibacteriota bacterium]MCW5883786.1 response regulator transcription factor [Candidatus Kapabacteria bacterium]